MKHKTHQVSLAQCQSLKNILYVWESKNENCKSKNPKVTRFDGTLEESLNQNLGKGPPGRARSPGAARGHPPEIKADFANGLTVLARSIPLFRQLADRERLGLPADEAGVSLGHPTTFNTQIQNLNTYRYSNFTNIKFYLS